MREMKDSGIEWIGKIPKGLIEHNNGMVDQKYVDKSGDHSYVIGQRLVVKENDAYALLAIIKKLAKGLMTL